MAMAKQSTQHKLDRVRPPRVHVTYDVEVGDAIELKELPFVMGVLGDFTGQPEGPVSKLKDRKFVEVNPDNFDSVLEGMKPHVAFSVENKLSEDPEAGPVFSALLKQLYIDQQYVPRSILVPTDFDDREALAALLSERTGHRIEIAVPQRGEKRSLVDLAGQNAKQPYR